MKTKIAKILAAAVMALIILAGVPHANCQAVHISVSGAANIFGAGHASSPGGGLLPPSFALTAGSGQFIEFLSVTGLVTSGGFPLFPDGSPEFTPTDVNSTPTISGIVADRTFFLTGVFLEATEPTNPSPARLDFSTNGIGRAFTLLSPAIAQTFFIGDGLTRSNAGAIQLFAVPPTATRLFLGVVDAWDGSAVRGNPGAYQDNAGSYEVQVEVVSNSVSDNSDLIANIHFSSVDICWAGRTNQSYQVQYRTNLSDTNWFNLGSSVLGAGTNCVTDGIDGTQQRFYRIIRVP